MAPAQAQLYDKDEKVLCFHHEMLYEAKILDVRQAETVDGKKAGFQYLIHYKGWKATWDDWVPQDRIRKHNEENLELAKNLKKEIDRVAQMQKASTRAAASAKKAKGGSSRPSEDRSTPQQIAGKKRVRDADTERIDEWRDKPQIRLPFPDIMKSILVDDWENVTWLNQIVPLPSKYPINMMLDEYRAFAEPNVVPNSIEAAVLDEMTQGVREYFNLALGRILLYKQERRQYMEIRKKVQDPRDEIHKDGRKTLYQIYGAEHFIRLLTMMPELICQTNLDAHSIDKIRVELINMIMWLSQKSSIQKYFSVPYVDNHYLEEHERNGWHKHESFAPGPGEAA